LRITPADLLRLGVVDAVLPEPPGGAQTDPGQVAVDLRYALGQALRELSALSPAELVEQRRCRFRRFGQSGAIVGVGKTWRPDHDQ
jgi:acetyl-CoA carboxylase carboxyl transferase subunit beta